MIRPDNGGNMENLCNSLQLFFKDVSTKDILENRISYHNFGEKPFTELAMAHMQNYSGDDAKNLYYYLVDMLRQEQKHVDGTISVNELDVLGILSKFDKLILKEIEEIPVCRYRYLLKWRMVSFSLEEELFTTSFLAETDFRRNRDERRKFDWKYVIHSDNVELNNMLNRGLVDNHFHLKGSAPYFYMSWINLMNWVNNKKFIKALRTYDDNRQQEFSVYHTRAAESSLVVMHLQAALIRGYLYTWIMHKPFHIQEHSFVPFQEIANLIDWDIFGNTDNKENIFEKLYQKLGKRKDEGTYDRIRANEILWEYWYEKYGDKPIEIRRFEWLCDSLLRDVDVEELLSENRVKNERDLVYACFCQHPMVELSREFIYLFIRQDKREYAYGRMEIEQVYRLLNNQELLLLSRERLQDVIEGLKTEYLAYNRVIFDYTQDRPGAEDGDLYGERWLLYRMFRKLYEGDMEAKKRGNLFYAYLVIKERIRAEMIQVNNKVGFENFLRYQNRKEEFIEDTKLSEFYNRQAIVSSFTGQPLKLLEARITPRKTAKDNKDYISEMDKAILGGSREATPKFIDGRPLEEKDFFYVFHFVKEPDREKELDSLRCRHHKLRKKIRQQAMGIYNLRSRYVKEASRVYGIDACSPEIGCRPEVFAQAFRYLKVEQNFSNSREPQKHRPRLRSTYHVGEDFLDIVDGMRAIDEAIYFLNMTHGDRLGHALALGVPPRDWYRFKTNRVLCTKQDVLDNLVWIYQKIRKYNIHNTEAILMKLQRRFVHLYHEIYGNEYEGNGENFNEDTCDIDIYYDAWKLRGDDPKLYYTLEEKDTTEIYSDWDRYGRNIKYPELDKIREEYRCRKLYHRYHYDVEVKRKGRIVMEYKVELDIIAVIEEIQRCLQLEILEKGLAIETNPSSNFLIGTFRAYEKHPITNWYNKGLANDKEELNKCPQLDVTINTDDQAVFGTSLENEFALMAVALEKAVDEEGNLKYKKDMIYDWLDGIRQQGFTRCFYQLRDQG